MARKAKWVSMLMSVERLVRGAGGKSMIWAGTASVIRAWSSTSIVMSFPPW